MTTISTYQDEQAMEPQEPQEANFAQIAAIYEDGVTLLFDGMDAPTQKHYLTNAAVKFSAGDRVRVLKDSGTYVVEYPVGPPLTRLVADYAAEAGSAETAAEATHAQSADTADSATTATEATHATAADDAANATLAQAARGTTNASSTVTSPLIALRYYSGSYYITATNDGTWRKITIG